MGSRTGTLINKNLDIDSKPEPAGLPEQGINSQSQGQGLKSGQNDGTSTLKSGTTSCKFFAVQDKVYFSE